ncbi:concanavalin A-like lectin/glucanase domain-containing protein [Biscogniauxia mediterranea]|nr:concanavalin A-like lectin/glucanase domain-containing protein [Biscogniauxia mediterranea]
MLFSRRSFAAAATAALLSQQATAQTYTSCNPLTSTSCPSDTALGMTIDVDFTKGEVNSFTASGGTPTYGDDGVTFTVAKSGDAPQLASVFYIMFGRVEISLKAAPGAGIVSSLVLQSDCLDEIDNEWLGADDSEVQTNYFGKGITSSYNRGQFNPAPNSQSEFITYIVDWTSERIVWTVGETVVRTLTYDDAESGQYPQTPMQIKFGIWAGGDSSNAEGTIEWARGPTDYSQGPFSMIVQSVKITDYSTGSAYKYGDTSGDWTSIEAVDGEINGNLNGAGGLTTTAVATAASSTATANVPAGGIGGSTQTATSSLPSGWVMTPEGKIVPSSSATDLPSAYSTQSQQSQASGDSAVETLTTYNSKGVMTTMTVPTGFATASKTLNSDGFPIVPTATSTAASSSTPEAPDSGASERWARTRLDVVVAVSLMVSTLYIML